MPYARQFMIDYIEERYGKNRFDFSYLPESVTAKESITLRCLLHDELFHKNFDTIKSKKGIKGCKHCAAESRSRNKTQSYETLKKRLAEARPDLEWLDTERNSLDTPITLRCKKTGDVFKKLFGHVLRDGACCNACRIEKARNGRRIKEEQINNFLKNTEYTLVKTELRDTKNENRKRTFVTVRHHCGEEITFKWEYIKENIGTLCKRCHSEVLKARRYGIFLKPMIRMGEDVMARPKQKIIEMIEEQNGKGKFGFDFLPEVMNAKDKVTLLCLLHNETFEVRLSDVLYRPVKGCLKCRQQGGTTIREVIDYIENRYGKGTYGFDRLPEIVYAKTPINLYCFTHEEYFTTNFDRLKRTSKGCPKCGRDAQIKARKFDADRVQQILKEKRPDVVWLNPEDYKDITKSNMRLRCLKSGKEFITSYNAAIGKNVCCSLCTIDSIRESNRLSREEVEKVLAESFPNYTLLDINLKPITNQNATFVELQHTCGHVSEYHWNSFRANKPRCKVCEGGSSDIELIIKKMIPENIEHIHGDRKVISPKELDFYFPDYNLAVEANGVYYHSEKFRDDKYHYTKARECFDKGITLLQFWETEIYEKPNIISSILNGRLGSNTRVYARKLTVKEVSVEQEKSFLEANHLQGYAYSQYRIGMFSGDDLMMLMTFGAPRFNKKYQWEIIRLCTKTHHTIVGGASRLFKKFILDNNPENCLTYADFRYSHGEVYKKLGFEQQRISQPNYFYVKGLNIIPRYKAQKHKLQKLLGDKFDESLSEFENMTNNGYYRVYDCGNLVFAWKPN